MTKVEGEPVSASELCFPGWGQQCRLSSGLPSQPASLVAQQGSASVSGAFTEQEPGFNWVVYSGASKLEDDVFWSLKCLEESLSFRLCVDFSAVARTLISLCLLCTPANCYAFICFVPRSYHFPLLKCFFFYTGCLFWKHLTISVMSYKDLWRTSFVFLCFGWWSKEPCEGCAPQMKGCRWYGNTQVIFSVLSRSANTSSLWKLLSKFFVLLRPLSVLSWL